MSSISKTKTIPLDQDFEEILISALRYALGRNSYIVKMTAEYISKFIPDLSSQPLLVMQRDLRNELYQPDSRWAFSMVDIQTWLELLRKTEEELDKRGYFVG